MTDERWLKLARQRRSLLTFVKSKKKKTSRVFWQVYVLLFWPPHHYESAAVSLISICVQTLQPVFTSKREKKISSATMFLFGFFFFHWQEQEMTCRCMSPRDRSGKPEHLHDIKTYFWTFAVLCPMGRWAESGLFFIYFFFFKEKPFECLATADLFSLLPSFVPFFHSCFPYPSPDFRLISAVNIHEARCSDQGASGRRNMKGFSETNYSASLTQNVPSAFFVLSRSVLSRRNDSLKYKH